MSRQFDLLHNVMMESGLSGFSCDQDPDEAESRGFKNSYRTPCLSQFQTKVRSNKAQTDHSARVKERLRSKLQGKLAEKMKPACGYKAAIPRSLSHAGNQAMEAESTLPDLNMLSPVGVKSPEMLLSPDCQQSMDIEMMSPAEVTPVDDPTGQPMLADSGLMYNISEMTNAITPAHVGHVTEDQDWAQISLPPQFSGLADTSADPLLANIQNWNLSGSADVEEEKQRIEVLLIEQELKACGEQVQVQVQMNDGTGDDYSSTMFPDEGSFLDELMSGGLPPMEQGGQIETVNQTKKILGGTGAIYEQGGTTEQGLLFDHFGKYTEPKSQLPSFNTSFQTSRAQVPRPPAPLPIKAEVRWNGRCYKIQQQSGAKIRAIMDEFGRQAKVEDEFFLTDATYTSVNAEFTLDNPGTYQFQVTVLPKPAKPPRRRHNKFC